MGFFKDLLFGKKTGFSEEAKGALERSMTYDPASLAADPRIAARMGAAEQFYQSGIPEFQAGPKFGGAGVEYMERQLQEGAMDPYASPAFARYEQAMMGGLGEKLGAAGEQMAAMGMLRGSGAQEMGARVTSNVMRQMGEQALGAGMESARMRAGMAGTLSGQRAQYNLGMTGLRSQHGLSRAQMQGSGLMGLASMQTGLGQADISNKMAALQMGAGSAGIYEEMRRSGKQRKGGLLKVGAQALGGFMMGGPLGAVAGGLGGLSGMGGAPMGGGFLQNLGGQRGTTGMAQPMGGMPTSAMYSGMGFGAQMPTQLTNPMLRMYAGGI